MEKKNEDFKIQKMTFITKSDNIHDSYTLDTRILGHGNFGIVKKAVHKISKQERAIKIVPKSKIRDVLRFKSEIDILRTLDHPNIVKLYEWFEDAKNMYLVMEFCSGGELFDSITKAGHFNEKQAAFIFKDILVALSYCHKKKIVHRDLKPENFLFESRKPGAHIKLIDFGLSKVFSDPKIGYIKLTTKAGTPYYIAPEVTRGDYDYKCDLWSAGVILFILLCGYPPFFGETDAEIIDAVKRGIYDFEGEEWEGVSLECRELITKLLTKDTIKRYTADQALQHTWIHSLAGSAKATVILCIFQK